MNHFIDFLLERFTLRMFTLISIRSFALLYINDPYPTPPKISKNNGIIMNHFIDFLLERFTASRILF